MALAFYLDEHVPRSIAIALRIRGIDVLTTQEDGQAETEDPILFERAAELKRVMVSFDADMLREATQRQQRAISFTGLVFARPTRISVGECVRDLELLAKVGESEDLTSQILYLPL
jgi:predicted nuclease of predicted toxin-antitoxin system